MARKTSLVVIGNGMVGHHLLERLIAQGGAERFDIHLLVEEPRLAYDRVNLSSLFEGKTAAELALAAPERYGQAGIDVRLGQVAVAIDPGAKRVRCSGGDEIAYDKLVLATGSYPFVPPIKGHKARGCFVYRTIEDLSAISDFAGNSNVGTVIGGGLLGLEAANALRNLGLETHIVECAPRLMPLQVDELGGAILRRRIEGLGVAVHTGKTTKEVVSENDRLTAVLFSDGGELPTDLLVFSAGIRPRDELGRACGLEIGPRGGFVVDDRCHTSQPDIYAIGECASYDGRSYGLVAPGYQMADAAAADLLGGEARLPHAFDMSTKLKLMGVDVASFGDAFALEAGAHTLSIADTAAGVYKKLVVSADKQVLLGGILVGDASSYGQLHQICRNRVVLPPNPEDLILPPGRDGKRPAGLGVDALPATALICSCHNVAKQAICEAIVSQSLTAVGGIKSCTKAGTGCGSCVPLLSDILKAELKRAGVAVSNRLCEHFAFSRQELFHVIKVQGWRTFDEVLANQGSGRGCEICKPAVASILASTWNEYIWKDEHIGLQDTNDRFLANMQRDGTYSVVPRVPGGEITPDQLIALGEVAKRFGLYTKITGAQRVDLFGARVDQLPQVWRELIAAGFESGHAYGKALRTVKSCVGSTWCRFGVQDSVSMAVALENRYKGLRSPHKLKGAASGCARECAEAQGKDFGVIATERGYNLYVCGNGGMKPQHAQLLASDLDEATVIRYLDRFLMFYVRTADRLERTATWFNKLEGGIEYLQRVVIDDVLGIGAELERDMQHVVDTYQCEWRTTVSDPEKLKQFRPFINSEAVDPSIVHVPLRRQHRAARWNEKADLVKDGI
jgi:nitrite reductase (NADH) large subunit